MGVMSFLRAYTVRLLCHLRLPYIHESCKIDCARVFCAQVIHRPSLKTLRRHAPLRLAKDTPLHLCRLSDSDLFNHIYL
jgi:hypothetical protein